MSYYAHGGGEVTVHDAEKLLETLSRKYGTDVKDIDDLLIKIGSGFRFELPDSLVFEGGNWNENEECELLEAMAPFVSGKIEMTGEDDSHWRFTLEDGKMTEESGTVVYENAADLKKLAEQAKTAAELSAACFRGSTDDECLLRAIQKREDDETFSITSTVLQQMQTDDDDETDKLLSFYLQANEAERSIMDYLLVSLCGWTMATLIRKTEEEG